jgi:hypothetical protein
LVDELPSRDGFEEWSVDEKIMSARPAVFRIHTLLPKGSLPHGAGRLGKSVREQWVKWKPENGTNFTVEALPFLADAFRPIPEQFGLSTFWYPTLSYGVDVKRKPSNGEGAWEWLYLRAEMSECANGRMGIDVVICEEGGEVVCTSRHTALIVSAERNSAGRVEGAKI